jgi:cytochrome b561
MLRRNQAQAHAPVDSVLPNDILQQAVRQLPPDKAQRVRRIHPNLITLHWLIAIFFLLAIFSITSREHLPLDNPLRPYIKSFHMSVGLGIFILALMRLMVRWVYPMHIKRKLAPWMVWAMHSVTIMLYVVMFGQPILGILSVQSGGNQVSFLGTSLPPLIAPDKQMHAMFKDWHVYMSQFFYLLFGMHVAGALVHHIYLRDATLDRMLGSSNDDFKTTFVRFVKGNIIRVRHPLHTRPEPVVPRTERPVRLHKGPVDRGGLKFFKRKSK